MSNNNDDDVPEGVPFQGWRPVPDPTKLTTEALGREISALRALIDQRIDATEKLFETKILLGREGGMALKELVETELDDIRNSTHSLHDEINRRFEAFSKLLEEKFEGRDKALVAALQAAKEAVEKANTAGEKRFDSVTDSISNLNATLSQLLPRVEADAKFLALDRRITENKDNIARAVASEASASGRIMGGKENSASMYAMMGLLITLGILGMGAVTLIIQGLN